MSYFDRYEQYYESYMDEIARKYMEYLHDSTSTNIQTTSTTKLLIEEEKPTDKVEPKIETPAKPKQDLAQIVAERKTSFTNAYVHIRSIMEYPSLLKKQSRCDELLKWIELMEISIELMKEAIEKEEK